VGAGDIVGSMFLLLSHAFFKALLFLAAGCMIQALNGEHDIFQMGNLRRLLPGVHKVFLIGALSLSAFPLIGGFFSKDRILLAIFLHPATMYKVLWAIALIGALLTPLYTMRLFFIAFPNRPDGPKGITAIPSFMQWILWPLALLSLFDGLLNLPFGPGKGWLAHYLSPVTGAVVDLGAPPGLVWTMAMGNASLITAMVVMSYFLFMPGRRFMGRPTPEAMREGLQGLLLSGFRLDRLYDMAIARPYAIMAGFLWANIDEGGLDEGLDEVGSFFPFCSRGLRRWTTGRPTTYLRMILLGFTAMVCALALSWYWS
jgi:NADH-quinone oxidoreductase subunit L